MSLVNINILVYDTEARRCRVLKVTDLGFYLAIPSVLDLCPSLDNFYQVSDEWVHSVNSLIRSSLKLSLYKKLG